MRAFCSGVASAALLLGASVAFAAGATITITHDLDAARRAEVVAIPFAQVSAVMPEARMYHLVVRDAKGRIVPSQITNYEHDHRGVKYDDLVFSHDFAKGEMRATFTLENLEKVTPPDAPCVYARFIPERLDDMAWENDRIAHRMYGTALNSEAAAAVGERLRGSGIDVWAKRVTYPIVDRWYAKGHDQFHKDGEGEGLDLYSIGGARGAGGTGIWNDKKLWTSDNFATAKVLSNGPRRAAFELQYKSWDAGNGATASETKRFTVDCGSNFDAVESTFHFTGALTPAVGLTEHKLAAGFPAAVVTRGDRWLSIWEEGKDGGVGVAAVLGRDVVASGSASEGPDDRGNINHLLLVTAADGAPVRYFTGAGWSKSGQFEGRAAWEAYVKNFAARIASPLSVSVSARP